MTDDKINQSLRAGGSKAPDVISSFTTNNVGKFCSSGALIDLNPFFEKSDIDPATTFPKAMNEYTQYDGNRCAAPLLGDAYGLYYNKTAFAKAGITAPPKTWSEFEADAKKLTIAQGDTYEQLGFMPNYHAGRPPPSTTWASSGRRTSTGTASRPSPPIRPWPPRSPSRRSWSTRSAASRSWRSTGPASATSGPKHPFQTGQVAMQLDGEWRLGMALDTKPDFEIGVAPLPVPDDRADQYGKGYITGTITGIAATSKKQNAAWEFVKYITTDTDAVVGFSNAIHNVPSTLAALKSPALKYDPRFKTFLDIAANPHSTTSPASVNGGVYLTTVQQLGYDYESGKVTDLKAGLQKAADQIDTDIAQAK